MVWRGLCAGGGHSGDRLAVATRVSAMIGAAAASVSLGAGLRAALAGGTRRQQRPHSCQQPLWGYGAAPRAVSEGRQPMCSVGPARGQPPAASLWGFGGERLPAAARRGGDFGGSAQGRLRVAAGAAGLRAPPRPAGRVDALCSHRCPCCRTVGLGGGRRRVGESALPAVSGAGLRGPRKEPARPVAGTLEPARRPVEAVLCGPVWAQGRSPAALSGHRRRVGAGAPMGGCG